jgi:hypothetical protein
MQAQAEVLQNHENKHAGGIGQGEARDRKYKRLKLGGGQAYDRSSNYAAVVSCQTGCYIRTITARVQLKENLLSWVLRCLVPR